MKAKLNIIGLQAVAYAAYQLDKFLKKTKEEQQESNSLASVLTIVANLSTLLNSSTTSFNEKHFILFSPSLLRLEKLLHMTITTDIRPIDIAITRYGSSGVALYNYLLDLGYSEYSYNFWLVMVTQLDPAASTLPVLAI